MTGVCCCPLTSVDELDRGLSLSSNYRGGTRWAFVLGFYLSICLAKNKLDLRLCSASILRRKTRHSLIVVLYLAWKSSSVVCRCHPSSVVRKSSTDVCRCHPSSVVELDGRLSLSSILRSNQIDFILCIAMRKPLAIVEALDGRYTIIFI